jgi:N-acetylneuraminic acid mutarotase
MDRDFVPVFVLVFLTASSIIMVIPVSGASPNSWIAKSSLPSFFRGLVAFDEKIYGFSRNATYEYNPALDTWLAKSLLPTMRSSFGTAVCQGRIYVIGGFERTDSHGKVYCSSANQAYNPMTDSWENKASLPTAREQLEANVVDGKIYLMGGRTSGQFSTVGVNEVYDPATDSWTTKASMPYPVVQYASAVVDDKIFVMGGQDEYNDPMNLALVQIYNPATDTWSFGASMPKVVWQAAAGATSGILAPKRIYLIGGIPEKSIDGTNLNQVYDPENDSWTVGAPMPTARFNLQVAVLNDRLYAMSGTPYFMGDISNQNEEYTPLGYIVPDPTSSLSSLTTQPFNATEVFPVALIAVVTIMAFFVCAGLLVYLKKHKRALRVRY